MWEAVLQLDTELDLEPALLTATELTRLNEDADEEFYRTPCFAQHADAGFLSRLTGAVPAHSAPYPSSGAAMLRNSSLPWCCPCSPPMLSMCSLLQYGPALAPALVGAHPLPPLLLAGLTPATTFPRRSVC